jgi:hypothetical protein
MALWSAIVPLSTSAKMRSNAIRQARADAVLESAAHSCEIALGA